MPESYLAPDNRVGLPKYLIPSTKSCVLGSQKNVCAAPEWFAMSATFGRAMKAKSYLEGKEVKCFVPMKYTMVSDPRRGKIRKLVPAISNLIFAYTTKAELLQVKSSVDYLQFLTRPDSGRNVPIVVPSHQMQQFMAVCETLDETLAYLSPDEVNLEEGTPVRIIGGSFDGVEATFVKVNGSRRKRRAVVLVPGVTAVMITELTDGYLEVL